MVISNQRTIGLLDDNQFKSSAAQTPSLLWRPDAWLAVGLAQGLGAMGGDTIKSFFKRRIGVAPGRPWIPADQVDFVIGALIPLSFLVSLSLSDILAILIFTFVADIAVNHISFYLGIRETKW